MLLAVLVISSIFIDVQANVKNAVSFKRDATKCTGMTVETCQKYKPREVKSCNICGLSNDKGLGETIINGVPVKPPHKYPWIVTLLRYGVKFCSGSIINAQFILTAAHCLQVDGKVPKDKEIYIKPHEVGIGFVTKNATVFTLGPPVEKIIAYPEFHRSRAKHDIALLKLKKKIRCDQFKNPICLPQSADFKIPNTTMHIAGWGPVNSSDSKTPSPILLEGKGYLIDYEECRKRRKRDMEEIAYCLMGYDNQRACYGDSGGGMFFYHKKKSFSLGVTSMATCPNCSDGTPTIYTSIPAHLSWIRKHVGTLLKP